MAEQQLRFHLQKKDVAPLESVFEDIALGTASFEVDEKQDLWRSDVIVEDMEEAELVRRLHVLKDAFGVSLEAPAILELDAERDWVSEVQAGFPPLSIGSFLVLGSHHEQERVPHGVTALHLDAGAAFGTGEHATTSGVLLALEWVMKREKPASALDMGCGSGILSLALAKRWKLPVLGIDIDEVSVDVAKRNVARNRLNDWVDSRVGNGYRALRSDQRYDLILSNILAKPLVRFAPHLARHLELGGTAILSGLLTHQENEVLHAHAQQGLYLMKKIRIGDWSTLILRG